MAPLVRLLGMQARSDRRLLSVWILGIGALGLAVAAAVGSEFSEEAERASILAVAAANPAFLFLRGLPDGVSVGAVVFFQAYSFTAVLAGLMSTFLVVRHTRADEELGRAELVGSTPVGRAAPLAATVVLGIGANIVLTGVVALGYAAGGLPLRGSIVAALAVGSVGVVFVGVAAVVAQLLPSGTGANGVSAATVGIAYLVRGAGDALGTPGAELTRVVPSGLSWLSPIGWGQATRPFSEPQAVPLLLPAGACLLLVVLALALRQRRDLGASLVAERAGRARAGVGGHSMLGLAWRLQSSTLIGWCVGGGVLGLIAGGLGPLVADAVRGNPSLSDLIARLVPGSQADIVEVFTAALVGIAGVLAAAAGVQVLVRLRSEESGGRAELLLATPRTRGEWIGSAMLIASLSVIAVCAVTGMAAGAAIAASSGDAADLVRYTGAALAHTPAALVFVAVTALAFAAAPRLTAALGWGLLAVGLILGQFGELLGLPGWLQDVSPYRHTSALPVEELDVPAALLLVAVAGLGGLLAAVLLRRRDLVA